MKKKVKPGSAPAAKTAKGKEKAQNPVVAVVSGEAKVGAKRKREQIDLRTEEPGYDGDNQEVQTDTKQQAGGRKRKRRRKAAANTLITPITI